MTKLRLGALLYSQSGFVNLFCAFEFPYINLKPWRIWMIILRSTRKMLGEELLNSKKGFGADMFLELYSLVAT